MRRIAIVQSCLCNLTQQPQPVLWKLDATVDNTPRQKAMSHGPLVSAWHTTAKTSSPQTSLVLTIPVCDSWVVLEHGGGGTVSVGALGWSSNSSMARGGLVGEAFAEGIAGRPLSPSGCGEGGDKAHGEEGVVSAWDCLGCKIFPTRTSSSDFCKTHPDATQHSVDCESRTPTRGATQKSVDCESLTPTRGATTGGGLATGHTPTPSHFPATFREGRGGGGGGWVGGFWGASLRGGGAPGPQHIWLKMTALSR